MGVKEASNIRKKPTADKIAAAIVERVNDHEQQTYNYLENFIKWDKMYRGQSDGRKASEEGENKADTFVMETLRNVETNATSQYAFLMQDDPFFEVMPEGTNQRHLDQALNTQALLEKQIDSMPFETSLLRAIRQLNLNGTTIVETPWLRKTRWAASPRAYRGGPGYEALPILDVPGFFPRDIVRVHFDPIAQDIDDAEWIAVESEMRPADIEPLIQDASRTGKAVVQSIKDLGTMEGSGSGKASWSAKQMRQNRGYNPDNSRKVRVVDYWGRHPLRDLPVDYRIVVVNDQHTVIETPNPYAHGRKPFLKCSFIELEESFYGLGGGTILQNPQQEINQLTNLLLDLLKALLYGPMVQEGGQPGRHKKYKWKQFGLLPVSEYGKLSPLFSPQLAALLGPVMNMISFKKEDIRGSTGATNDQQGLVSDVTAREAVSVASNSSRRIAVQGQIIAKNLLRPWLQRAAILNQQFLPSGTVVRVLGPKGAEYRSLTPRDIIPQPEIRMKMASDIENRNKLARNLNTTLQTVFQGMQVPGLNLQGRVDVVPMINQLLKYQRMDYRDTQIGPSILAGPGGIVTVEELEKMIALTVQKVMQAATQAAPPAEVNPEAPSPAPVTPTEVAATQSGANVPIPGPA